MKKIFFLVSAAGCVALNACSTDPVGELEPTVPEPLGTHTLTARTPRTAETRTHLGPQEGAFSPVLWSADDRIAVVTDRGSLCQYVLTGGENTEDGTFTVSGTPTAEGASSLEAYYPYSAYSAGKLTIPGAQTYAEGSFSPETNPMYARTTGDEIGTLEFTHVAGVINIRLTDDGTGRKVKSIRLVSTDKTLSGAGTLAEGPDGGRIIVFDGGGNEAMQHVDEAGAPAASDAQSGSEITLTCPEPVTLDAETPTDFLFVVPAQTYPAGTLSFRITDDADQTVTKALSKQLVVGRAKIVDFTAIAIPKVVVAESADDVSDAIKKAASSPEEAPEVVQVGSKVESDAEVTIPKAFAESAALTVEVPQVAANAQLTFKESSAADETAALPERVSIVTDTETAKRLVIDMPNTTVTVNGKYTEMTASTAENTLYVEENAEVGKLTLKKGNAKIYGTVREIVRESGYDGRIVGCIGTQAGLERILAQQEQFDCIVIEKDVTGLDGKGGTLSKPLEIAADAEVANLTIAPTSEAEATHPIVVSGDGVKALFDNVLLVCNTAKSYGISCTGANPDITLRNSEIKALGTDCRGVSVLNNDLTSTESRITIDGTSIHSNETAIGSRDYTEEEIAYFKSRVKDGNYYPRGIAVGNNGGTVRIDIRNGSAVEGFFYAVNIAGITTPVIVNAENSRLDGRAALNVHGKECVFDIEGSELIGRNYFTGPTEDFAAIVLDSAVATAGSNAVTVTDSEIRSYNSPQTATNHQFSADLRSKNNTLRLLGATKLVEAATPQPARMNFLVMNRDDSNTVEVAPSVTVEGREGAHTLPVTLWDGATVTEPMSGTVRNDGTEWFCYEIYEASDLAWIAREANAGRLAEGAGVLFCNDIDLGNHEWTPIGYTGLTNPYDTEANYTAKVHLFSGCVFVNGHTVRNVRIDLTTPARGLFGQVYGTDDKPAAIADLHVENVAIEGEGKWTGGLAGYVRNVSRISNCSIKEVAIACGEGANTYGSGGLFGYFGNNSGEVLIEKCSSENVAFTGKSGWNNGGLIGKFYSGKTVKVTIRDCQPSKGYFRTVFAKGQTIGGITPYYAPDGYNNSWFIGNITNTKGFDLVIERIADNSANWIETDAATGSELTQEALSAFYKAPYISIYDNYKNTAVGTDSGTITIDGVKVHPAAAE